MKRQFLIVTHADDLHALAVQAAILRRGLDCQILECNELTGREAINFAINSETQANGLLRTSDQGVLEVASIEAIWWRRFRAPQVLDDDGLSQVQRSLIDNDCAGALVGTLLGAFAGRWLSSPGATDHASNKLNQLSAARAAGFRIPDTVVTQSPEVVEELYRRHGGHIIVKPVVGTPGPLLFTKLVDDEQLRAQDAIRACPAIYQEFICGSRHIRLNCFGDRSYAGLIETEALDWRPDLQVPISRWPVPSALHRRVRAVLDILGLKMGIIDLKEMPSGEIVWFEVNPQGQFLFLEGLTGEPLTEHFADYFTEQEAH